VKTNIPEPTVPKEVEEDMAKGDFQSFELYREVTIGEYVRKQREIRELEFSAIKNQFRDIFHYGLMDRCGVPFCDYEQSYVTAGEAQRDKEFHTDSNKFKPAFGKYWQSPQVIILIARDVGPTTACIIGFRRIPWGALDKKRRLDLYPFNDNILRWYAKLAGKFVTCPEGHVVAIDERTIHAGQISPFDQVQTFARGTGRKITHKPAATLA
jgi:hypothetical protein